MTQTLDPAGVRAVRQAQRRREDRQKAVVAVYFRYKEFEDAVRLVSGGEYLIFLEKTVIKIAQEKYIESKHDRRIAWDTARNRILTLELLEQRSKQFGKDHATILSDIGRVASYKRWLRGIYDGGEAYFLPRTSSNVEIYNPPSPPLRTVAGIKAMAAEDRERMAATAREFLEEPARPKTLVFDFIGASNRQGAFNTRPDLIGRKKPRRNWRYER